MKYFHINAAFLIAVSLSISTSNAGILFQDSFESGDKSHRENNIAWTSSSNTSVVNDFGRRGNHSLRFFFKATADGGDAMSEQRFTLGENYSDIWIKYDMYVPDNYFHRSQSGSANNKSLVTLWDTEYYSRSHQFFNFEHWPSGDGNSRLTYVYSVITPHNNTGAYFVDRQRDLGKWIEWIIHIKLASSSNNDGTVQVWKTTEGYDRELIVNVNNIPNYVSSGNFLNTGYLLGWTNSGFDEETYIYIDDVIVSDSPIGMNPPNPPSMFRAQ